MKHFFIFLLCCCAGTAALYARPKSQAAPGGANVLRVGIMPDADSLPFMLARDRGLFAQEGVAVELVHFSNPQERDAALQSGRLDGAISDLLAAAFLAAGGFDFKVTSLTDGRYGIVGSARLGIATLRDLRGKRIGLSVNTIIQYTVDTQLAAAGVSMNEYEAVAVPRMPMRLEMALGGQIEAVSLPEPLLTAAVAQGAVLLSTTDASGIDAGALLFSKKTLDTRLEQVRAFYRAYYQAAQLINAAPDSFRDYLVENAAFPQSVKNAYRFVTYRKPSLPADSQIKAALGWLQERKLLEAKLTPADLTDSRAVSQW